MTHAAAVSKLEDIRAHYSSFPNMGDGRDRQATADVMDVVLLENYGTTKLDAGKTLAFIDAMIRLYGGEP
jgi:hypothetical protein